MSLLHTVTSRHPHPSFWSLVYSTSIITSTNTEPSDETPVSRIRRKPTAEPETATAYDERPLVRVLTEACCNTNTKQKQREIQDSSYRSPLMVFRSHKFSPIARLHVDRRQNDGENRDTISLVEFKPSELPLCPFELQGVCSNSKCVEYAHWRDLRLSKSEQILEIMRAFVGDSEEDQQLYKSELQARLKELKGSDSHTIISALIEFRRARSDEHFLDWHAFKRVDIHD